MIEKPNYQNEFEKITDNIEKTGTRPRLLLHSCCAPCSSYVISYVANWFDVTVIYYNPNIFPKEEYEKRKAEQIRLIKELGYNVEIKFMDSDYDTDKFKEMERQFEDEPQGGLRCFHCYRLRLEKTAAEAKAGKFDYFGTTLTVSPHKSARVLNQVGKECEQIYGVKFMYSDFKKKDGFKKSIELSCKYKLYRQNYCGCESSMKDMK
ncbi:MAG: epoxyqueuosine reductase QueH [Oscillospiraceae bacterium]|jgi:predicted adenine nucleotide alpha hydrolase (AANH) superfamily ATPase|nr:epoxyqueuosine reductase QueH [Oscillospiraceae bacterium]